MLNLVDLYRFRGFGFPRSAIGYAVWAYHRFVLDLRDVEDLMATRSIPASHETIRDWVGRVGHQFAAKIRRDRPDPDDKRHLDEVVPRIKHCHQMLIGVPHPPRFTSRRSIARPERGKATPASR